MTEYRLAQIPDILTSNKEEFQQCGAVLFFKENYSRVQDYTL